MARRFTEKSKTRKLSPTIRRWHWSEIGILRPFAAIIAAILAIVGVVALIIVGIRAITGRRGEPEAPVAPTPPTPPPPPRPAPPPPRRKRLLGFGIRHPLTITLLVVILVIVGTLAYIPFSERSTTIGGIRHEPSDYDEFFTYSQMEAMTHFAKCDAMLYSTRPEEELENVKERMAIEVEFDSSRGAGAASRAGQYTRRVRSPEEIAEAIRLAEEFYERVNCK